MVVKCEWNDGSFEIKYDGKFYSGKMSINEKEICYGREGHVLISIQNPTSRKLNKLISRLKKGVELPNLPASEDYI